MLAEMTERARALERDGRPDALAWFDAAYVTEALKEVGDLGCMKELRLQGETFKGVTAGADGYTLMPDDHLGADRRDR